MQSDILSALLMAQSYLSTGTLRKRGYPDPFGNSNQLKLCHNTNCKVTTKYGPGFQLKVRYSQGRVIYTRGILWSGKSALRVEHCHTTGNLL